MLGALSRLPSWELDRKEEDVRGWPLRDQAGNVLGTIDELIVDTDTQYVAQVVLADGRKFPAHDVFIGDGLVTLGVAPKRTETPARATTPAPAPRAVAQMPVTPTPRASASAPTPSTETAAQRAARAADIAPKRRMEEDDLVIPVIDEELEIGKRTVEAGGLRVHSHMTERPVEKTVHLREERVVVERLPIDRSLTAAEADAGFREGSVEMKALSEVPIVGKRAHVVEEVIITKNITERTERVRDTVRHTDARVEELPSKPGLAARVEARGPARDQKKEQT